MPKPATPHRYRNGWRVKWLDHEGTRCSKLFADGEYKAAVAFLDARRVESQEIRAGRRRAPPRVSKTLADVMDYFERERAPQKRSGADSLSIIKAHLRPAFGGVRLREFGVEHIDRYKRERAHLAPNTLRNHLSVLSVLLKLARKLEWIGYSIEIERPASELAGKVDPADRPRLRSREEVTRLLTAARDVGRSLYPERPTFLLTLYATALATGMRQGEIAGLRWRDVNFERRGIEVERSFTGRTKTVHSRRTVAIVNDLLPVLRAWHDAHPPTTPEAYVFPNGVGRVFDPSAHCFHEHLHAVLDAAGFARPVRTTRVGVHALHFHSLRHSYACFWMESGGTIERLQANMGHVSKEMTRWYAYVRGYAHPEDFGQLGGLLTLPPSPTTPPSVAPPATPSHSVARDRTTSRAHRRRTPTRATAPEKDRHDARATRHDQHHDARA